MLLLTKKTLSFTCRCKLFEICGPHVSNVGVYGESKQHVARLYDFRAVSYSACLPKFCTEDSVDLLGFFYFLKVWVTDNYTTM